MSDLSISGSKSAKQESAKRAQRANNLDGEEFVADRPFSGKTAFVTLQKTPTDVRDVLVRVNFRDFLIRRGMEVEVPVEVCHALGDAMGVQYIPEEDRNTGRIVLVPQETLTVPFQRHTH